MLSGLIWIHIVCKGYQQMTKVATCKERVKPPCRARRGILDLSLHLHLYVVMQVLKAQVRACMVVGSSEPLLLDNVVSTKFSHAGSFSMKHVLKMLRLRTDSLQLQLQDHIGSI